MGTEYMIVDPYRRRYFQLGKWFDLAQVIREHAAQSGYDGSATRAERMHLADRLVRDGGGSGDDGELSPEAAAFVDKAAEFCQEAMWLVHVIADGSDLDFSVRHNKGAEIYGWAPGPPFTDCTPPDD